MNAYGLVVCTLSTGVMAVIAWVTDAPFIFPSLGPSIILSFCTPRAREASARNMVGGHLIGAAAGLLALAVFGLLDDPSAIETGVTAARVLAAALSIGLTALGMVATDYVHAPAGSTTLLISLGIFRTLENVGILAAAVLIVAAITAASNRFALRSPA